MLSLAALVHNIDLTWTLKISILMVILQLRSGFAFWLLILWFCCDFLFFSELLFNHFPPFRDHWWKNGDLGARVLCGGRSWRKHQGWDMLLRRSFDQMQSQVTCWYLRAACIAGSHGAHWSDMKLRSGIYDGGLHLPWMKLSRLLYLEGFGDRLAVVPVSSSRRSRFPFICYVLFCHGFEYVLCSQVGQEPQLL